MSVQVEKLENSMAKLTIEVSAEEFESALQDAYNKQKKNISIPGFRKGKVPRQMVERVYGAGIFYEDAADAVMPQAYADAAKECGEDIVSRPVVDIVQIEKGKPFIFTAEVALKPDLELGAYKGVEVVKEEAVVTDEELDESIKKELQKNARTVTVEDRAIEDGDTAVIDYEGFLDGVPFDGGKAENHSLKIGSGSFIPGFEEQLIGHSAGEDVDLNVTFPEEYHAEELAGKPVVFKVKIHEIKTDEVPELDDDFVQDVSEFDTVDEYKADMKEKMLKSKADSIKMRQQNEALEKIIESSSVELPEAMVLTRCDDIVNQFAQQLAQSGMSLEQYMQYSGSDMTGMRDSVRPEAENRIKSELVLDKIVAAEGIEITDEEVENELSRMSEMYGIDVEQLKTYMAGSTEDMKLDLASRKAMDLIYENVVFVDAPEEPEAEEAAEETAEEAPAAE